MGKIKTEGRVTLEFEPDLYEISITVNADGKTSGEALISGKAQTESLLQALQDTLQIQPEQLTAESESLSERRSYQSDTADYDFSRNLLLTIPADNHLREAVTDMLAEMNTVMYSVNPVLADENAKKQQALDAAVQCAKDKAEKTAASLHCKVTGFEEICTDGTGASNEFRMFACADCAPAAAKGRAADLQNPKMKVSAEVTVVWLTE